jgi:hypothetical protein
MKTKVLRMRAFHGNQQEADLMLVEAAISERF